MEHQPTRREGWLRARLAALRAVRPPWRIRSLTWRILALNVLALATLVVGLLYLDRYRGSLVDTQLEALTLQAEIVAAAIGEAAVREATPEGQEFLTGQVRPMVRRLAASANVRMRLFAASGDLVADSQTLAGLGAVQFADLAAPRPHGMREWLVDFYDQILEALALGHHYPPYREAPNAVASDYPEALAALRGEEASQVRETGDGSLVLSVSVPVQRYRQVLGALVLSSDDSAINAALRDVRIDIVNVFLVVLAATVLLSLYLASTIARPVRQLAEAADRVRRGQGRKVQIPDLSNRGDEIGELSASLKDMTEALWARMDAIERFAADVAHEIKNPLSSLRSAVETIARVEDPTQQKKLMTILLDDVKRLDRLISDISDASRLDAELSRAELEPVEIGRMLETLVEIQRTAQPEGPTFDIHIDGVPERLMVMGIEGRLVQVFRNVLANAVSFSPSGGKIDIRCAREGDSVVVRVDDQGPGIPDAKLEAIFDRFYTQRPKGEKFGTHSGLGLSISRQIVDAHGGRIWAENITDPAAPLGDSLGARFLVRLPAAPMPRG
ncbi:MAG TPA: stimulus-sensing domain-containing protein [Alphaproteobacteria bacterium]|jgi:two-component system sensor histidine kinase ChvG|nr:stimulus-sensing domain-containing protein [Alphaproteobacteria bacterium]